MLASLVYLLGQVAIGIYLLIAAACALMLWRWWRSQRALRSSRYDLERDLARYRRANALTILILLLELALVVVGIQLVVLPKLRMKDAQPSETS